MTQFSRGQRRSRSDEPEEKGPGPFAKHLTPPPASPTEQRRALGHDIAKKRVADHFRRKRRRPRVEALTPTSVAAPVRDPLDNLLARERRALSKHLKEALRQLATDDKERALVDLYLSSLEDDDGPTSLRKLGRDLWPTRPQTACEVWKRISKKARRHLGL